MIRRYSLSFLAMALAAMAPAHDGPMAADLDHRTAEVPLATAWAACGGAPIQGGHDVQPTPARDKCLAEKMHLSPPKDLNLDDVGLSPGDASQPVPPAASPAPAHR